MPEYGPGPVSPVDGGCWFCWRNEDRDGESITFSYEFDTNVHPACARARLLFDPSDQEAQLIVDELEARP